MCGRFAQYNSRNDFFEALGIGSEELTYDAEPIGRYNVSPGTKVLLLNERDGDLKFDPVYWGYGPEWWDKPPLINARSETAATGRMFKPLWKHGRVIVPASGWFEWKRDGDQKQPYFIYQRDKEPLFFWPSGSRLLIGNTGRRVLSSSPLPAIRAWWTYTIAALLSSGQTRSGNGSVRTLHRRGMLKLRMTARCLKPTLPGIR